MKQDINSSESPGPAVDAHGEKVTDPTDNVRALNYASIKRIDDMHAIYQNLVDEKVKRLEVMSELRADHAVQLNNLESKRIDAIRQVDVLAVNTAADRASQAIQALAAVTAANADNLRNALNSTASTIAAQLANTVSTITERIAALEKSQYEGAGRQKLSDPMMDQLSQKMNSLIEFRSTVTGKTEGISASWATLLATITIIGALYGFSKANLPATSAQPQQVIYVPGPESIKVAPSAVPGVR